MTMNEADVRTWIISYIADFLMIPESDIQANSIFGDLGLDSADSIIISGAMEERFNVEVDATLFLRNPNIDELIEDLRMSGYLSDQKR